MQKFSVLSCTPNYCFIIFLKGFHRVSAFIFWACACLCVRECVCVFVTMDRSYMEAITGSKGPQTPTVPLSLGQTEFISLPPLPLFSFCLSISISFSLSLSLYLSLSPPLFAVQITFVWAPTKGQGETLLYFFYWEQKARTYFNSHRTFPICTNKPLKIPALIRLKRVVCVHVWLHVHMLHEKKGHLQLHYCTVSACCAGSLVCVAREKDMSFWGVPASCGLGRGELLRWPLSSTATMYESKLVFPRHPNFEFNAWNSRRNWIRGKAFNEKRKEKEQTNWQRTGLQLTGFGKLLSPSLLLQ